MESAHRIRRALAGRLGKVERVLLLGVAATLIAVPLAVAGPPASPNLDTTPASAGQAPHAVGQPPQVGQAPVPNALPHTGDGGTAS